MHHIRSSMPALANKSYFNYGGQGPLPSSSLEAMISSWQKIQELGPFTNDLWPYLSIEIEKTRNELAKLCEVRPNRIALTENVTSGCILPLLGLPFDAGDHILISDSEHPGVVAACKEMARRQSLIIDVLPVKNLREGISEKNKNEVDLINLLEAHLSKSTRLVVLSHLLWNTGQLMPITTVSKFLSNHPLKPYLLVDAAQSFGQIPLGNSAASADIYAFTGHKWACGPEGLGGVALSQRVLSESSPTLIGWRGLQHEGISFDNKPNPFHSDGRRFEVATSCIPLFAGLRNSLKLFASEGTQTERFKIIRKLSFNLWKELNAIKGIEPILQGQPPSGIVSFTYSNNIKSIDVVKSLGKKSIWIRNLQDPDCLRACVHIMTEFKEIEGLTTSLKEFL